MASSAGEALGSVAIDVRGNIIPLRKDFADARREAQALASSAGKAAMDGIRPMERESAKAAGEVKNLREEMKKAAREALGMAGDLDQADKAARRSGIGFEFARKAALQLGVAIGAALSIRNFFAFEDQMAKVSTLVDTAVVDMDKLRDAALRMAAAYGGEPQQQAAALYEIISAGVEDAAAATEILNQANKLAVGGVTDVKTAADGLTSVLAAYGDRIESAAAASDSMFISAKVGKTSIEELSLYLGQVAPLAAQAGVSFDELTASVGVLTKAGITSSTAVQGLRGIIASVITPSAEASKLAKKLGLDYSAAALQSMGFQKFLETVREKTKGSTEAMAILTGRVEALTPLLALTGEAADDYAKAMEQMAGKTGATEAALTKMANSPGFQAGRVWSALQVEVLRLATGMAKVLVPALKFLADNMHTIVTVIEILAGAAIPLLVRSWVMSLVPAIIGGMNAIRIAIMANPIGLLITALAAAVTAAFIFRKSIAGYFADVLRGFQYLVNGAIGYINKLIDGFNTLNFLSGITGEVGHIGNIDLSGTIAGLDAYSKSGDDAADSMKGLIPATKGAKEAVAGLGSALDDEAKAKKRSKSEAEKLREERAKTIKEIQNEIAVLRELVPLYTQLGISENELADRREWLNTLQKLQLTQGSAEGQAIWQLITARRALNDQLDQEKDRRQKLADQKKALEDIRSTGAEELKSIEDEIATFGMAEGAVAAYRLEQELLNEAIRAQLELTPELRAEIHGYAMSVGAATDKLAAMRKAQKDAEDAAKAFRDEQIKTADFFREQFADAIEGLIFEGEKLGDTFKSLALAIAKAAIQAVLLGQGPLANLFGTSSATGGGGGWLGSLFGSGSAGGPAGGGQGGIGGLLGSLLTSVFKFHGGTGAVGPGAQRTAVPMQAMVKAPRFHMGLRYNEFPAILEQGEEVVPKHKAGQRGGGNVIMNVYPRDYDSFRGSERQIARKAREAIR